MRHYFNSKEQQLKRAKDRESNRELLRLRSRAYRRNKAKARQTLTNGEKNRLELIDKVSTVLKEKL